MMKSSLLPSTKFVLAVSAIVQLIIGLIALFVPDFARAVVYPPPLETGADLAIRYFGAAYLGTSVAAGYVLRQDSWIAARTYLAYAAPYVALSAVLTLLAASTPPGIPLILWVYLALSAIYLPLVVYVWREQSGGGVAASAVGAP